MMNVRHKQHIVVAKILPKTIKRANDKALELLADRLVHYAPEDTGALKDSIEVDEDSVVIGASYASYVDQGTRYQTAQPFIEPAVTDVNRAYFGIAKDEFFKGGS